MYDVIIIGGGVIGIAIARNLAAQRKKVLILEKELDVGLHASGRDSGLVHSGFHHPPGSLAARLCVEGNYALRKYAESRRVPFEQIGSYVVAIEESQVAVLEKYKGWGDRIGVPNLQLYPVSQIRSKEPSILGHTVLYSPTGAIIDARLFIKSLLNDAVRAGAHILYLQQVVEIREEAEAVHIATHDGLYAAERVINCSGIYADRLAHSMGVGREYLMMPFRGMYFTVSRSGPPITQSMVFPVNELTSLVGGLSVSKTLHGSIIVGPGFIPTVNREAYDRQETRLKRMTTWVGQQAMWKAVMQNRQLLGLACKKDSTAAVRQNLLDGAGQVIKGLRYQDLSPSRRVEIRPQLIRSDGQLVTDLVIGSTDRTIHVLNMVSPGLTCSLSFAKWLTDRLQDSRHATTFNSLTLASVS